MKKILVLTAGMVLAVILAVQASPTAAGGDCDAFGSGGIDPLTTLGIGFTCATDTTVYFGACDSGGVPDDDLFSITYGGAVVSYNTYVGSTEFVYVGSAQLSAGDQSATLNSLNTTPFPPATYSFAISPEQGAVSGYLGSFCGVDFGGTGIPGGDCIRMVPVFTTDTAPTNGTLKLDVQFGEMNREEGWTLKVWDVAEGQRINNDYVGVPAPKWVRLWWQADGESEWSLLTSQYWTGDGTSRSEYGVDCESAVVPSYHTSFGSAITSSNVPALVP